MQHNACVWLTHRIQQAPFSSNSNSHMFTYNSNPFIDFSLCVTHEPMCDPRTHVWVAMAAERCLLNATWHTWMSHGTYEWFMLHICMVWNLWMGCFCFFKVRVECVMAHVNESWRICMSHGLHEEVMAHLNESWHMGRGHGTYEWIMAHDE